MIFFYVKHLKSISKRHIEPVQSFLNLTRFELGFENIGLQFIFLIQEIAMVWNNSNDVIRAIYKFYHLLRHS